jgi:hypothetical protein
MRRRIARGESCFHPDDLTYRPRASDQTGALDRMLRQSGVELVERRHLLR